MLTDADLRQVINTVIRHLNNAADMNQPFRRIAVTEKKIVTLNNGAIEITIEHDKLKDKVDELKDTVDELKDKVDKLEKEKK